ncbi:MAG TPA: DUF2846 domain-containing protein [Bdellovibrionota bacterium]|nr:DUF2846 domain-containing protein [Bdellovibrionota bacterium]
MNKLFGSALGLIVLFASGCASPGPKYSSVRHDIPALKAGEGRIYVYRQPAFLNMGAGLQPDVDLNGKVIGTARVDVVTFIDVAAGTYKISCTTEKTNELELTVTAGETKYVRLVPYVGIIIGHIDPQLVSQNEGEDAIQDMALVMPKQMHNRVPASLITK